MTITVAARKAKGRAGEMEILAMLSNILRLEYDKRGWPWPEGGLLKRGPNGKDIVGLSWLAPEVKRHEQVNEFHIEMWWNQAKTQAPSGAEPVLFWRPNHSVWHVRMFGKLILSHAVGAVKCPVDITIENFLLWFHNECMARFDNLKK